MVNDIHKRGGTIIGTSRGGHDTSKIVDSIQDRGINQVCEALGFLRVYYKQNSVFTWHLVPIESTSADNRNVVIASCSRSI